MFSEYIHEISQLIQAFVILLWTITPLICTLLSFWLIRSGIVSSTLFLGYCFWIFAFQDFHYKGGMRNQILRRSIFWHWFRDYFPITLIRTVELNPNKSYIFGCHPHGIISFGALCNFGSEANGFEDKFPGINLRLLTLRANFKIPFWGLILTNLGICDASRESCNNILRKGPGNAICLVLGGAKESLDAHPGTFNLTLKNRKGFIKVALENGSSLVPVFSFGENDVYEQIANPRGSTLRTMQLRLQKKLGFAIPLIKCHTVFGILPYRKPIRTVVGTPINVPKFGKNEITPNIINEYHKKYMDGLRAVWDSHKDKFELNRSDTLTFIDT